MESTKTRAIWVGAMVIVSLTTFIILIGILSRWQMERAGFRLKLKFMFLNNLTEGSPVLVAGGINVGFVEKIYQEDLQTYVQIYLNSELENRIPKTPETVFSIFTTGMMGQKYINLQIAEEQEGDTYLQDGDVWEGINPPSIDQMMLAFSSWFDGKNGGQVIAEIMQETGKFISNLNAIASENRQDIRLTVSEARQTFTKLSTQVDTLMQKLNVISGNVADISTKNKEDIEIMLNSLATVSNELNLITQRINSGRGTIGKFLKDDEIYQNANEAMVNAKEFFQVLKEKPYILLYKQ